MEIKSAKVARTSYGPSDPENNFPVTTEKSLSFMTDSSVMFYPKHNQMYSKNTSDLYDNKVEEWALQRNAQLNAYDNIQVLLEISGNSFLRVGAVIQIFVPSPEANDGDKMSDNLYDKFLSGLYMVTAIQHVFQKLSAKDNKITYTMKIECTKDALEDVVTNRTSRKED